MEPMTVDEILQWHAEQMRIAHEQEARHSIDGKAWPTAGFRWFPLTASERIPPLGHDRGAKTKALWNGKAYEIVPIVEPEPDPAQRALDEFIAVRKAKREAPAPVGRSPISDWKQWETECALARAVARTDPDRPLHQRLKPYRGA